MLYQKGIEEISWADVESFCAEGIAEGAALDYKADFPNSLENTIAAMANTIGGVILIGVSEDGQGRPVTPIAGIKPDRGLADRVMNIILTNITPPVFPEIQVCKESGNARAVVVIRIHESDETPHAIAKNTRVYIRTGSRNNPEELATIDKIEWLANRRRNSVVLRDMLFDKAVSHYAALAYRAEKLRGILRLSLSPLYPHQAFATPPAMNDIYKKIQVPDYSGMSRQFPLPDQFRGRLLQDGIGIYEENLPGFFTELNVYGLYFYGQSLARTRKQEDGSLLTNMQAWELFCRVDEFVDSAELFFQRLEYYGALHYRVELEVSSDCPLVTYAEQWFADRNASLCPDGGISYVQTIPAGSLATEKSRWILEPIQRICWGFDYNVTEVEINRYYTKHKPKRTS